MEEVVGPLLAAIDEQDRLVAAVTAPPAGGRAAALDRIEAELDGPVARVQAGPGVVPELPEEGIVIVEDCQLLYERRIDGFEGLEQLRSAIMDSEATIVLGWDRYAWQYIAQVREIARLIDHVAGIPELSAAQMGQLLEERDVVEGIELIDDRDRSAKIVDIEWRRVGHGERQIGVPVPRVDIAALRGDMAEEAAEDAVVRRLTEAAGGLPGVAWQLWQAALHDGAVRYGDISATEVDDIDAVTAWLLYIVLTNEQVSMDQLDRMVTDQDIEGLLYRLRQDEIVRSEDGTVRLRVQAIPAVIDALDRRRLLW